MAHWTPGKPEWPTPVPNLIPDPADNPDLTPAEAAVAAESKRLIAVLGGHGVGGFSLTCVADIDVTEAVRRLEAEILTDDGTLEQTVWADPLADRNLRIIAATDVPGGCVLFQPWGYGATMPGVLNPLSVNTTCYGMYANPKSGNQGTIVIDGVHLDADPGAGPEDEDNPQLLELLYDGYPTAHCFAHTGLKPTDARSITGPSDLWLLLPDFDYWSV